MFPPWLQSTSPLTLTRPNRNLVSTPTRKSGLASPIFTILVVAAQLPSALRVRHVTYMIGRSGEVQAVLVSWYTRSSPHRHEAFATTYPSSLITQVSGPQVVFRQAALAGSSYSSWVVERSVPILESSGMGGPTLGGKFRTVSWSSVFLRE